MSKLPNGWAYTLLGNAINIKYGKGLRKDHRSGQGHPVYGSNGIVGRHDEALTDGETIIIGRKGSIGEIHLSESTCWPIDTTYFIDSFTGMPIKYWYYFLKSLPLTELNKATAIPGINREDIYKLSIPIPPLNEQKRIAKRLDHIFTELYSIQVRLSKIPDILQNFHQRLIDKKINEIQTSENFKYIELKSITNSISDGDHQAPPKTDKGIPFLVISNISQGHIDIDRATRFVPEDYYNNLKDVRIPEKGDILYSVTGSIGIPAIVETEDRFCFQRHIAIIKPNNHLVTTKFLFYCLNSSFIKEQAKAVATGTAQLTVPLRGLRSFRLKIPSIDTQRKIVDFLDANLELADQIEKRYEQSNRQINQIMQSILNKAFAGELVPQDPNDEHASILLKKIKEEKQRQASIQKKENRTVKKSKEVRKMISSVLDTLQQEQKPLTAQNLLEKSGYPRDADSETIEKFFLDIRKCLIEGTIVRERVQDEDVFKLAA